MLSRSLPWMIRSSPIWTICGSSVCASSWRWRSCFLLHRHLDRTVAQLLVQLRRREIRLLEALLRVAMRFGLISIVAPK